MEKRAPYLAFLLKLWPVVSKSKSRFLWRASLENPYTGERHGFQDLDALLDFVKALTREETFDQENRPPTGTIK
jgi:hypothetical protein